MVALISKKSSERDLPNQIKIVSKIKLKFSLKIINKIYQNIVFSS